MLMRKNKAFALLSILIAATVFGVLVFSASASEDVTTEEEETAPAFCGFRKLWLDPLTDEQRATLKEMIKENRAEIQSQIEAWGVEFSELDDGQHKILQSMMEENRAEVEAQLDEWGIEIPVCQGPRGLLDNLTDEQKEELQTMRQGFQDAVNAKLEEWGVEVPEFDGPHGFGMMFHGRGDRGFGLFKP